MEKLNDEFKLCLICMDEHMVTDVQVTETMHFKAEEIAYSAKYIYCRSTEKYLETEALMKKNNLAVKDAYKKKQNWLSSREVSPI